MYSKSFLHELQRIQCDLSGGIKTLGQVEVMLSEECLPNHYSEMLHVIHTYMQGTCACAFRAMSRENFKGTEQGSSVFFPKALFLPLCNLHKYSIDNEYCLNYTETRPEKDE